MRGIVLSRWKRPFVETMEGRWSRTKPAEVENGKTTTPATPLQAKSTPKRAAATHVSPPQRKSAVPKVAVTPADDRCVPTVGGENKRKRAPRGPAGRNVKAKIESVNEDDAKVEEEVSVSNGGGHQVQRKEEDRSGTENDEAGVSSKEQVGRRRGSSRLRIRPSKFRESLPLSSSKVKGEQDNANSIDSLLPGTDKTTPKPKEGTCTVQLVPSQVDTRELIARNFFFEKLQVHTCKRRRAIIQRTCDPQQPGQRWTEGCNVGIEASHEDEGSRYLQQASGPCSTRHSRLFGDSETTYGPWHYSRQVGER